MRRTVLEERLRHAKPDYVNVDKEKILSRTNEAVQGSVPKRVNLMTFFKSSAVAVSGMAVAATAIFVSVSPHQFASIVQSATEGISSHMTASRTKQAYSFFGIHASFRPMLPTATPNGYSLTLSELQVDTRDTKSAFPKADTYTGMYISNNNQSKIRVLETPGDSINNFSSDSGLVSVLWQRTMQSKNQTYYVQSSGAGGKSQMNNIVGFVKDHVVYELLSRDVSDTALLKFAQSDLRPAPVRLVQRLAGTTYQAAKDNISFHPILLPNVLASKWILSSAGSTFAKTGIHATSQSIAFDYKLSHSSNKSIMVLEAPTQDASTEIQSQGMYHASQTWNDARVGLTFQVSGNISTSELNQIVSALKASINATAKN